MLNYWQPPPELKPFLPLNQEALDSEGLTSELNKGGDGIAAHTLNETNDTDGLTAGPVESTMYVEF